MSREDKKGGALGKGLDALISSQYVEELSKNQGEEPNFDKLEDIDVFNEINKKIVDEVIGDVKKNPRISLWSAKSAAVLRFLRKTEPEFSISSEASILIDQAVKAKYPEIWEMFEDKV